MAAFRIAGDAAGPDAAAAAADADAAEGGAGAGVAAADAAAGARLGWRAAASPAACAAHAKEGQAEKRLRKELQERRPHSQIAMRQSNQDPLQLHFAFHSFPSDSPYRGGCYHGVLKFPETYPFRPPEIRMRTENGRFETGVSICTTASAWHPEEWSPSCTASSLLQALLAFFQDRDEHGIGACKGVEDERRRELAAASGAANAEDADFREFFPQLLGPLLGARAATSSSSSSSPPPAAGGASRAGPASGGGADAEEALTRDAAAGLPPPIPPLSPAAVAALVSSQQPSSAGEPLCWICMLDAEEEPLTHPCGCRGTNGGVHKSCLMDFVRHNTKQSTRDPLRCRVCRQLFSGLSVRSRITTEDRWIDVQGLIAFFCLYIAMSFFLLTIFLRVLIVDLATRYSMMGSGAVLVFFACWRIWFLMKRTQFQCHVVWEVICTDGEEASAEAGAGDGGAAEADPEAGHAQAGPGNRAGEPAAAAAAAGAAAGAPLGGARGVREGGGGYGGGGEDALAIEV